MRYASSETPNLGYQNSLSPWLDFDQSALGTQGSVSVLPDTSSVGLQVRTSGMRVAEELSGEPRFLNRKVMFMTHVHES